MKENNDINKEFVRLKPEGYTTIARSFLMDRDLSLKARGVLATVLILPDNWDFSINGTLKIIKEGSSALRSAINELKENKYCAVKPRRENNRIVKWVYVFSGEKIKDEDAIFKELFDEDQHEGKQLVGFQQVENETQYNNEYKDKEENKKEKESNDSKSVDDLFDIFWSKYHKGSKQNALNQWSKLKEKEKTKAINTVDDYLTYCRRSNRPLKDCSAYLHQKCFNDDWNVIPQCYIICESDDDRRKKFKEWMCNCFPELLYHRNPLTYEQADELFEEYPVKSVKKAMGILSSIDIHQYYNIKSGIKKILESEEYDI